MGCEITIKIPTTIELKSTREDYGQALLELGKEKTARTNK